MAACEPAPQSADKGREAQRQRLGAERIDHAAHCLAITKAVSSLATPALRQQAAELGLDDVKPQFATRWHEVLKQQVHLARADTGEISAAIDRNAVVIRNGADLNAVADDAFDCGGEIERSGND
ncbi:MAG: hypothetical protein V4564_09705 [Pseudomonadota bacterium]|uniref:hypothetical protein n=1 Tax=Sphingomonas sp. ERG5 TaxID=1381597 RepID=UPI00054C78F3|nr:hypothetical protein [Sphingomonas sp. ERG5]